MFNYLKIINQSNHCVNLLEVKIFKLIKLIGCVVPLLKRLDNMTGIPSNIMKVFIMEFQVTC